MRSFSSSAINKSGKKFAPKAPARRAAPQAPGQSAPRKPNIVRQTPPSQPEKPVAPSAAAQKPPTSAPAPAPTPTPAPAPTSAPAPAPEPAPAPTPEPTPASVSESSTTVPTEPTVPETTSQTANAPSTLQSATPIPAPAPKQKPSVSAPVSIPIPAPKRKPSVSTPVSIPTPAPKPPKAPVSAPVAKAPEPKTAPRPPSPPPSSTVAPEPTPSLPVEDDAPSAEEQVIEPPDEPSTADIPKSRPPPEAETGTRPAKRQRTTAQRKITIENAPGSDQSTSPPRPQPADLEAEEDANELFVPPDSPVNTTTDSKPTRSRKKKDTVVTDGDTEAPTATRKRRRTTRQRKEANEGETESAELPTATRRERKTTRPRRRKENTGTRKPRTRRTREPTPEGADEVEIAPAAIKMSDLCKDLRTGKMSNREAELRKMDAEEAQKKQGGVQEVHQETEAPEQPAQTQNDDAGTAPAEQENNIADTQPKNGLKLRMVNDEIVLDAESLQVDRHADAARNVDQLEDVVETSLTRRITQASFGKRSKAEPWDEDLTDLFYRGLRMFGTDFMMISKLFPGRSRHQIKLKFNNEERRDPERIKQTLLGPSETIDIATYSEMTNEVYDDPRLIQQELDEDKKQIEDQHSKEKEAQEELFRNPDGVNGDSKGAEAGNGPAAKSKTRNRKQPVKSAGGGTEEIVGSIDDLP